jgi:uncharacterized membrane protein
MLNLALVVLHVLTAAAWFGAMVYSMTVLHPRAMLFFKRDRDFEAFITIISDGARWKVLSAFALIAASGIGLTIINGQPSSALWLVLIGLKSVLFLVAIALFVYVSWRLWPARIFADDADIPVFQRRFKWIAWALIGLAGLNVVLGVVARMF